MVIRQQLAQHKRNYLKTEFLDANYYTVTYIFKALKIFKILVVLIVST